VEGRRDVAVIHLPLAGVNYSSMIQDPSAGGKAAEIDIGKGTRSRVVQHGGAEGFAKP
jgi:hypothetical protein